MERLRIPGLSYLEARLQRRHPKVTLNSEINACFEYFDAERRKHQKIIADEHITLIHGLRGIEIKRVAEGKGYAVEMDGVVKTIGVDRISKEEQDEMIRRIRNITLPYAEHLRNKK